MSGGTAAVVVLVLLPAAAWSQEHPPSFAAQAEIVTVDVVVLGPDGKPVPDLTRDDFVVKEDGRPQTVTAFEAIEVKAAGLEAGETRSAAASRVATNVAPSPTRRTFAVVFDDVHVGALNIEQAKKAVAAFVAKEVRPGDHLLLYTTSDARYWATTRGAADEAWLAALDAVRSHQKLRSMPACRITEYEAMRIEDFGDRTVCDMVSRRRQALGCTQDIFDCGRVGSAGPAAAQPRGPTQIRPTSTTVAAEAHAIGRSARVAALRPVREMLRAIGSVAGRKEVVFVSEGFPLDPSMNLFREVRQEAARVNAAIHFLDPRGLTTGPDFLSAAATTGIPDGPDLALTLALWPLEDGGTKALAEETGGLVLQTNDLVSGLATVADESRVSYLLGYAPTNEKRDGRYRKLKVEVRRPGLQARARAGYFASSRREKRAPERPALERATRDLFDADGIPLRLAVYVMGPAAVDSPSPKTGLEVLIAGEVRLEALESRMKNGRRIAEPSLRLLTGSREREWHDSRWTLEVRLSDASPTAAAGGSVEGDPWHPFITRIAMEPGDHRARLVVESGGRIGSVTTDFVVPPLTDERLTTPILSDRLLANAYGRRVMPVARRRFPSTSTLHCWIELLGAAKDEATGQPQATAAFVARSADGREWASGAPSAMSLESGTPTRLISIPLAGAPSGESELVLTVRDERAGLTLERLEPFRVER